MCETLLGSGSLWTMSFLSHFTVYFRLPFRFIVPKGGCRMAYFWQGCGSRFASQWNCRQRCRAADPGNTRRKYRDIMLYGTIWCFFFSSFFRLMWLIRRECWTKNPFSSCLMGPWPWVCNNPQHPFHQHHCVSTFCLLCTFLLIYKPCFQCEWCFDFSGKNA